VVIGVCLSVRTASAQVCVPLGHSSLYLLLYYYCVQNTYVLDLYSNEQSQLIWFLKSLVNLNLTSGVGRVSGGLLKNF